MKKSVIIVGVIVVAVVIAFFSFIWPVNDSSALKGTIGGVEKAEKFRGEQMEAADLLLENEEFVTFTQSAEWQNAMKNEELVNFLKSDDFSNFITMSGDMKKLLIMNQYFDSVKLALVNATDMNEANSKEVFASNTFENFLSSRDFSGWGPPYGIMYWLNNQDFQQSVDLIFSQEFQNAMENHANIETLHIMEWLNAGFSKASFSKFFNQDFQQLVEIINSQEFQNAVQSNQDYQNAGCSFNQDFQKLIEIDYNSQEFQKVINSQEFQTFLRSNSFESILFNNQDSQQNMLGAFQDYMQFQFQN